MVIWVTGISGAGKTTLCSALAKLLKPSVPELVLIDGDVVRQVFGGALGYREEDRVVQIKRIQSLTQMLADQHLVVLVAALYAHPDLLAWNRANLPGYYEVYLDAPLELVGRRDAKGIYARAARGQEKNVVGVDIPWHAPDLADLRIDAAAAPAPNELARQVAQRISWLAGRLPRPGQEVQS